ncbi:uncharacterized protein PAC_07610 [Phialocephala subalpina]|uniref:Heterokaryon incompatibility domain-containing protein n=1 Tax=Phialocephala subalpina TaxID=576137 RepID=A0A1L7WY76_9HELO|nr:uncharacterized protein PAC_07610 [Phialocephala subalpina]
MEGVKDKRYSWEPWLQSTHAINDGTAVIAHEALYDDREFPTRYLTIRPRDNYGTNPDVVDGLCILCRWMLDHLRFVADHRKKPHVVSDRELERWGISIEHWPSTLPLVQAAAEGCRLCGMILSASDYTRPTKADEWPLKMDFFFWGFGELKLGVYWEKLEVSKCLIDTRQFGDETQILDLAIQWLLQLLEVNQGALRLRETLDIPKNSKYATLSHCWGPEGVDFKLTKESFVDFHVSIQSESLSKTFQEAVTITRKLGIHYLWIDSLCIIQDDPEDWRKESVTMSEVYGNSYVTIAAASARNGSEGCFIRNNSRIHRVHIKAKGLKGGKEDFQAIEVFPSHVVVKAICNSNLARRGWALQESILSPRTLYFSDKQLFWECNTQLACESFPHGAPTGVMTLGHVEKGHLSDQWDRIIGHYTDCQLTKRRDVLVAMSGIIKRLEKERQDTCVAGIWRNDAEGHLLWKRRLEQVWEEETLYTAPTWSWASSPGIVELPVVSDSRPLRDDVEILDMNIVPVGEDRLGELRGGSLSIACRTLILAKVLFQTEENSDYGSFKVVIFELPTENVQSACVVYWDTMKSDYTTVFLLPFSKELGEDGLGLVLVATEDARAQYKRVGCFGEFSDPGSPIDIEEYALRDPVNLKTVIEDLGNRAIEEAFASFVSHGTEKWGVIKII